MYYLCFSLIPSALSILQSLLWGPDKIESQKHELEMWGNKMICTGYEDRNCASYFQLNNVTIFNFLVTYIYLLLICFFNLCTLLLCEMKMCVYGFYNAVF